MTFDFQVNDRRRNPDRRKNCLTPEQLESRLLLSISSVSSSSLPIVSNLAAGLPVVVSKNATVTATLDFPRSSRIRSFFGVTVRHDDKNRVLVGQSIVRSHHVGEKSFTPDGWFGKKPDRNEASCPVTDQRFINKFAADFRLNQDPIVIKSHNAIVQVLEPNHLAIFPQRNDFDVVVTGFDVNRDLFLKAHPMAAIDGIVRRAG